MSDSSTEIKGDVQWPPKYRNIKVQKNARTKERQLLSIEHHARPHVNNTGGHKGDCAWMQRNIATLDSTAHNNTRQRSAAISCSRRQLQLRRPLAQAPIPCPHVTPGLYLLLHHRSKGEQRHRRTRLTPKDERRQQHGQHRRFNTSRMCIRTKS